ncbi:MerR family transcriptional regulator [Henriciella aquimarina]|uniref:MerR family transcriptional regulator n=1 Tax=Henriciella aquimarina TaxID=545261 RepID=UPI000A038948|nr:MerR family transcriptional regulator [Henriciella aquimarina]
MPAAARKVEKSADAYRSIGEAADELGLQPHVLRYWEGKFTKHLKPMKRPDGRRMFRPEDMQALRAIQLLVHERGMTLKGAGQLINEQGVEKVLAGEAILKCGAEKAAQASPARELQQTIRDAFEATEAEDAPPPASRSKLEAMLADLEDIKQRLDKARLAKAA